MSKPQRQLSQKEKRSLIQECLKIASELSNKTLGRILGVSHNTIQKIRQEMEQAGQIAPLHTLENEWVKPNEKMVSDITYLWTDEGWLYIAGIMDLCGQKIVGLSMSEKMTKDFAPCPVW